MDEEQLTMARRALSERTANGKSLSAADLTRMVEEEFGRSGLGDLLEKMPEEADDWVWKYQADADEWRFFADDYEPVNSVKMLRTQHHGVFPVVRRGTTMPKVVREIVMRSGLTLFEKSDAGTFRVALDKAIVTEKMADDVLAVMEWMEIDD